MGTKILAAAGLAAILLAAGGTGMGQITIETVPVGNPGNAPDTRHSYPGHGAVGYEFSIGRYEVTAGQYAVFLNAVAATDVYELYNTNMWSSSYGCKIQRSGLSDSYTYSVAADWADRPVNYVSWGDAARFANWLHNGQPIGPQGLTTTEDGAYFLNGAMSDTALVAVSREADWKWAIPSEDEWYKAAYHENDGVTGNYLHYPTSTDTIPGYINNSGDFCRTGDGSFTEGGADPGNYATYDGDYGPDGIGSPYYRTEVGEHENSDSLYGTFDQGGNVSEWNEANSWSESYRGLRGGSFRSDTMSLYALYGSIRVATGEGDSLGFRVSEVPEPASMAVLALGSIAMLPRRRYGVRRL